MSGSALVSTNYAPLTSFWSNDSNARPKPNLIQPPKKPGRSLIGLKYAFLFRTGVFIIFEFGFIILASLAMTNPIPLDLPSHITATEAKGGVTVISITWHAFAIIIIKDVILYVFSAEWAAQYCRSGRVTPGDTDVVSRMTAGLANQIQHFMSRKATLPYRLAFISALLLMPLNGLGPSTITVNPILVQYPLSVQVANLTITENTSARGSTMLAVDRANLITRLEQLENASYGFRTRGHVLVPWPASDLILTNGTIKYESDIVNYDFKCSWKQPTLGKEGLSGWVIDNKEWATYASIGIPIAEVFGDATILPMEEQNALLGDADSPLIAFLFLGSNTTLSKHVALNLEGLPTTLVAPSNDTNTNSLVDPVLATILLCDPQPKISPAIVTLSQGALHAEPYPGLRLTKNIPQTAANAIFSQSLLDATSSLDNYGDQSLVNPITRVLFLADPSFSHDDKPEGIKPLSLDQINEKMNNVLPSAAKAYLSGYRPNDDNLTFPSFKMILTGAIADKEVLALVGSKPFLIALIVVLGLLVIVLVALVMMVRADELQTFDLENIVKALHVQ